MASMIGIGVAIDYSLFILARYREERQARSRQGRGAGAGALDLGPRGHLLRPRRDHLPRRALDGRQPGAALDGAGGDDRGRGLDPDRDDAAAGADRDARRPRPARRRRRPGRALLPAQGAAPLLPGTGPRGRAEPLLGRLDGAGDGAPVDRRDRRVGGLLLFLAIPLLSLQTGTDTLGQFPKDSDVRVGTELASAQARRAAPTRSRSSPPSRARRRRSDRAAVAALRRRAGSDAGASARSPGPPTPATAS